MSLDIDLYFKSIESVVDNISEKTNVIKSKNTLEIEHLNQDFTTFLDLGRRLIQSCLNEKVCK